MELTKVSDCGICGSSVTASMKVREMMFGLRSEFEYARCERCGCLRNSEVPSDLAQFYPSEYFPEPSAPSRSGIKHYLRKARARYCLQGRGLLGAALKFMFGTPTAPVFGRPDYFAWLRRCNATFDTRILDVGCGAGTLVKHLWQDGFRNVTGADPFMPESSAWDSVRLLKRNIEELDSTYDLIMLHHTFEHLPDPLSALKGLQVLLRDGGFLVLRTPVADSFAFSHYGTCWAQLDAPRHLFIHTRRSMEHLASSAGFVVREVACDSNEFQFWASEQYQRDIPLRDSRSYSVNPEAGVFSRSEIQSFRARAKELNESGEGDQACFYLEKQ